MSAEKVYRLKCCGEVLYEGTDATLINRLWRHARSKPGHAPMLMEHQPLWREVAR